MPTDFAASAAILLAVPGRGRANGHISVPPRVQSSRGALPLLAVPGRGRANGHISFPPRVHKKPRPVQKDEAYVSWYHLMFTKRLPPVLSLKIYGKIRKGTKRPDLLFPPFLNIRSLSAIYSGTITCALPSQPTELKSAEKKIQESFPADSPLFGVRLRDVFTFSFPRASHHPAAFCVLLLNATCSHHGLWHIRDSPGQIMPED